METTRGGVLFSARLIDSDDNKVVTIKNNEIDVLNGETYVARQSSDKATISVKNKKGTELFYTRFINSHTIILRGFFGCDPETTVHIADGEAIPGFMFHDNCFQDANGGVEIK